MNDKILDKISFKYPFANNIIKLLIKNGLSINYKLKINKSLKKYYNSFLNKKEHIIYDLNIFNRDIISLIIQY